MGLFRKKTIIYISKGTKEDWRALRDGLKKAGIRASASSYEDEIPVGGCGAKMDIRDFGPEGKIDRTVYVVRVAETDRAAASKITREILPDYIPYEKIGGKQ